MGKQEFIDRLRAALNGRVSPGQVIENVNYYEDYINMQIRMGKTEEEVLESLGDPRLIAKSIISANGDDSSNSGEFYGGESSYSGDSEYRDNRFTGRAHSVTLPRWLSILISILILVGIIVLVFSVMSALFPVIMTVLILTFFFKLFRDWLH